jgi:hypothetical protein
MIYQYIGIQTWRWMNTGLWRNTKKKCRTPKQHFLRFELHKVWHHMTNNCDLTTQHTCPLCQWSSLQSLKVYQHNEIVAETKRPLEGLYFETNTRDYIKKSEPWKMSEQDYIHKVPVTLHDNLQRQSHKPDAPPPTVTWMQLPRKHTNTGGTFTALNTETHWSTRTWPRALSLLVTPV